jgi:leader peptidase (prepilin peptidase) / N-methyltransferase
MGSVAAIPILLAVGLGGGAVGWWCCASPLVRRSIFAAKSSLLTTRHRCSRSSWSAATGVAAGAVAGALILGGGRRTGPFEVAALAAWACGLAVLALIDSQELVLPTVVVRAAIVATGCPLLAASVRAGNWRYFLWGAGCAVAATAVFGLWALIKPQGLGFGDVRVAGLVALGAGALSPANTLVALSVAPLAAGVGARYCARRAGSAQPVAVPLAPFLAIGGILAVVASAF